MPFAYQSIRTIIYSPLIKNRVTQSEPFRLKTHHVRPDCIEEAFKHLQVTLEPLLCRPLPFCNSAKGVCNLFAHRTRSMWRETDPRAQGVVVEVLTCSECVSSKGRVRPNGIQAAWTARHVRRGR
jgi:hypothetical protein